MTSLMVDRVDVWACGIKDEPGGLAKVLDGLRTAGADLDFIVARRSPESRGTGVVFVAPLRGDKEVEAAATLGFNVASGIHSLRVEGKNRPGVVAEITEKVAAAHVDLRGLSAAVIGRQFIMYLGFDTADDVAKAEELLTLA
jgi:hypothetical protein